MIYKDNILICVISKRVIRRIVGHMELNGLDREIHKLLNSWNLDLFSVLFDKEKIVCPQWYNIAQVDIIGNRVGIQILELLKDAMTSGMVRYSE